MSQARFDDGWETLKDQLYEKLQHVENNKSDDDSMINNDNNVFPCNAVSVYLDDLIDLPIKPKLKLKSLKKTPLGDISNLQQPKLPPKDKQRDISKEKATVPALARMESLDDGMWTDFDMESLSFIEAESKKQNSLASSIDQDFESKYQSNSKKFTPSFSTAKGNALKQPSEEAKLKAKKILESDVKDKDSRPLSVSDDLFSAQVVPDDDNEKLKANTRPVAKTNIPRPMEGFTTANGKKLKPVSDDAAIKAKALLEGDNDEEVDNSNADRKRQKMNSNSGFTTASGSRLKPVSESSMKKVKEMFQDDETPKFSTASGMSLKAPSEDSMKSAAKLLEKADIGGKKRSANGDLKYVNVVKEYSGFSMGNSKKSIDVSSQAKNSAYSAFQDAEKQTSTPVIPNLHKSVSPSRPLNRHKPGSSSSPSPRQNNENSTNTSYKPVTKTTSIPAKNNRVTPIQKQNKPFKSPIIQSNLELTKAAVRHRSIAISKATLLFNLTVPDNRYKLSSLGKPMQFTKSQLVSKNIPIAVINMTVSNAQKYLFDGSWGPKEAYQDLIQAGALPKRASFAWVENHYGWIVWKIACLIRSYPDKFKDNWTSEKILNQLLYRYEREINMGHRPVLKKIMEQDDISVKHMILLISDIVEIKSAPQYNSSSKYRLQLTDGWYQVPACIDLRMERAITKKKLKVGQKLSICGAKIIGDREARSPLEINNAITLLSITTNGCLPAHWGTKLGYHPRKLIIRSIPTIFDDGGTVTALDIIVCRKFPILYSESLVNGTIITRTAKEEEETQRAALGYDRYGLQRQQTLVNFRAEQPKKNNKPYMDRASTHDEQQPKEERRVSSYFKVRICDARSAPDQSLATLLLSNANEIQHMDIVEGNRYRVFFVMPYHPKNKKYPGLDLKTTRNTRWESPSSLNLKNAYVPRFLSVCNEIRHQDLTSDFDLVVLVLYIGTETKENLNGRILWHQTILVMDQSQGICQINFRLPLHPLPNYKGQVLGLMNLRFDMHDTKFNITCLKATDETEITSKISSSAEYIQKGIQKLKLWVNHNPQQVQSVNDRILNIVQ